jgi:hypothetical protein
LETGTEKLRRTAGASLALDLSDSMAKKFLRVSKVWRLRISGMGGWRGREADGIVREIEICVEFWLAKRWMGW